MHPIEPNSPCRTEWRCRTCRALLGIAGGGQLHIKHGTVEHWIRGRCEHSCRRCRTLNTIVVGPERHPS